ncbi:MAG: deoxyribodipyrimidine photo-lyase [Gloeomargaritaceae cyanobacterium C42_A2020_066]|nr:deoxyribodipyrimidine photo-lyase [Gloeomargaritaceae cyanobacterium C42_A2020_066]
MSTDNSVSLLWFRRDLRLDDNAMVTLGTAAGRPVLPLFVIDPWFYEHWAEVGQARVQFLFESLVDLDAQLRRRGSRLYLLHGPTVAVLQQLTQALGDQGYRPHLWFNRDVQVDYGAARDQQIQQVYRDLNLPCTVTLSTFLLPEGQGWSQWRPAYYSYQQEPLHSPPARIVTLALPPNLPVLTFADLKARYPTFWPGRHPLFRGGATEAHALLTSFLAGRCRGYTWKLSRPWLAQQGGCSLLSPHFTLGALSTRQAYQQARALRKQTQEAKLILDLRAFQDRLRWRDSATQRLLFQPELAHHNLFPEFDACYSAEALRGSQRHVLQAWQAGLTGFPLVDASLRQLRAMGWMNFRMRAMCATFLTVNAGIGWQHGAQHYMSCLVDGDVAIDHWQWQSQAGVAHPLSSTFRIYNPTKNLMERDGDLRFIHYWLPELRGYTLEDLLAGRPAAAGVYPYPILDWAATRRVRGKRVADLRRQVRQRLETEGGTAYAEAQAAQATVDAYRQGLTERYP